MDISSFRLTLKDVFTALLVLIMQIAECNICLYGKFKTK